VSVGAWLKRTFRGRGRFDPTVGQLGIQSCTVRPFSKQDLDACRNLYELNEPGRFPPGYLQTFTESLESPAQLFLVAELHGQIAAVGGLYRTPESPQGCSLAFGMVHPNLHRRGLGTTLLLARLAVLARPAGVWWAFLSSAGGSATFFERFGFLHYGRYPLPPDMREFDCYRAYLEEADWDTCSRILAERHVHLDRAGIQVPVGPAIPNISLERKRGR
jgi:N-acetylglutamate synthase-like GNAT family acetyltransferase